MPRVAPHAIEEVVLLRYEPMANRAVIYTHQWDVGARDGVAYETVDAVELPSGRRRSRIHATYPVHVTAVAGDHLGRFTGSWQRDVRLIAGFLETHSLPAHWRPNELVRSPNGRLLIVNTAGRHGREEGDFLTTVRGRLLHPLQTDDIWRASSLVPMFSRPSDAVVYSCHRSPPTAGSSRAEGLCTLDVTTGSITMWPMPQVDDAAFMDDQRLLVLTSERVGEHFHVCLGAAELHGASITEPTSIRCWDDAWLGSRIVGHPGDASVILFLRTMGDVSPNRIVEVGLSSGEVLRSALAPEYTKAATLLPERRVIVETENHTVGFVDLERERTLVWEPTDEARLGSFTPISIDGALRIFAIYRASNDSNYAVVELDMTRLFPER